MIHQVAGSEEAFRRLLDQEWDLFSKQPAGTRISFLVCSAPGRRNAKRLRELAGSLSYVETLYHRKGEHLCSVSSLDRDSAVLVAEDGGGETFSLEPMPHLAKLAPAVTVDPSPAALFLSSEGAASKETGGSSGLWIEGERGGGRRNLRTDGSGRSSAADTLSAEQRAQLFAPAGAIELPKTQRLVEDGARGRVDAIEVTLALHPGRSKKDVEQLAEGWLSLASDQKFLSKVLKEKHFWGPKQKQQQEEGGQHQEEVDGAGDPGAERWKANQWSENDVSRGAETGGQRAQELAEHEKTKRREWANFLDGENQGRDQRNGAVIPLPGITGQRGLAACKFDGVEFAASPSGKKVLLHRPHEIAASGGAEGKDNGCLSALLAFLSLQPEVHYVTARKKSATMNLDAAWITQSGVNGFTPLWDKVGCMPGPSYDRNNGNGFALLLFFHGWNARLLNRCIGNIMTRRNFRWRKMV